MRKGQNCAPESIIVNRDTCEDALKLFGLKITNLDVDSRDVPAGCYWKNEGYFRNEGYFNKLVNPSSTNPTSFDERAGVCSASGRN